MHAWQLRIKAYLNNSNMKKTNEASQHSDMLRKR